MDKEEILQKNKQKSKNSLDEREQRVYNYSFGIGAVVVGILCLVFSIYRALNFQPFYEFVAIITAFLSTTFIYQFRSLRRIRYLAGGIAAGAASAACIIMFFVGV